MSRGLGDNTKSSKLTLVVPPGLWTRFIDPTAKGQIWQKSSETYQTYMGTSRVGTRWLYRAFRHTHWLYCAFRHTQVPIYLRTLQYIERSSSSCNHLRAAWAVPALLASSSGSTRSRIAQALFACKNLELYLLANSSSSISSQAAWALLLANSLSSICSRASRALLANG